MKKLVAIVCSLFLLTTISAKAEMGIGISGAFHMLGQMVQRSLDQVMKRTMELIPKTL